MDLKLREYRKNAGLKQWQMAEALDVKLPTYRTWENQSRKLSLERACECADLLECTVDELAGRKSVREYTDPRQEQLNGCYESLNESSKTDVANMVKSIAADPARRIEKEGEGREDLPGVEEIA